MKPICPQSPPSDQNWIPSRFTTWRSSWACNTSTTDRQRRVKYSRPSTGCNRLKLPMKEECTARKSQPAASGSRPSHTRTEGLLDTHCRPSTCEATTPTTSRRWRTQRRRHSSQAHLRIPQFATLNSKWRGKQTASTTTSSTATPTRPPTATTDWSYRISRTTGSKANKSRTTTRRRLRASPNKSTSTWSNKTKNCKQAANLSTSVRTAPCTICRTSPNSRTSSEQARASKALRQKHERKDWKRNERKEWIKWIWEWIKIIIEY